MYQLNEDDRTFVDRTKSVFDSLANIESTHKCKTVTYVTETETRLVDVNAEAEPVDQVTSSQNSKAIFLVPKVPIKRCLVKKQADYQRNPEKWTKYSLEDVKEFGNGANYAVAMSFLNSRNKLAEEENEDEEMVEQIQFNRPLKKKFDSQKEEVEESFDSDVVALSSIGTDSRSTRKKSAVRRNLRKKTGQDEESDEHKHNTIEVVKKVEKKEKKRSGFAKESVGMDEDEDVVQTFEAADGDANEANQYDLFD